MKIISLFLCLLLCFACEHGDRKLAYQSQRNLDEADLYLESFDVPKALEYSIEAKNSLTIKKPIKYFIRFIQNLEKK